MLVINNCYFNILNLPLEEGLEIITDILLQVSENRAYFVYNIKTILANKEEVEKYSYKRYLTDIGLIKPIKVDKEKVIKKADDVVEDVLKAFK